MTRAVLFSKRTDIGSNFYPAPITVVAGWCVMKENEIELATNEHLFQASKVTLCSLGSREMFEEIACAPTPDEARRLGRLVPLDAEEIKIWDDGMALGVMLEANLAKYQQNWECGVWLKSTGNAPLIEHRPDRIWGDGLDGKGRNLQGKVLELVRATL